MELFEVHEECGVEDRFMKGGNSEGGEELFLGEYGSELCGFMEV